MNTTPVTMVGTVVRDLKGRRVGPDDALVVNFRVVSNERRYDKESGTWVNGDSLFLEVSCWRRLAENTLASIVKGDPVVVHGKLRTREYETKDGEYRSITELEASSIGPDLGRCSTVLKKTRRPEPVPEPEVEHLPEPVTGESPEAEAPLAAASGSPVAADPGSSDAADSGPLVPVPA